MNAGTSPQGRSCLTLSTYRLGPDGKRVERSPRRKVTGAPAPERLAAPLSWPPCRCPRCRTRNTR